MRYLGGKSRLAKAIVDQLPLTWADEVWEPFMGGGAVTAELARHMREGQRLIASDAFLPLVAMWVEALHGWDPGAVDETSYESAKRLSLIDPMVGFAGFGCTFGAKWFGGFARSEGRDHAAESRRNLLAQVAVLRSSAALVFVRLQSFFDAPPAPADFRRLIYCDPPYAGTEGYPTGAFDHERFWAYCREWRRHGARVYVSEFTAPDFATPIWRKERKITVTREKAKQATKVDTLYEVQP